MSLANCGHIPMCESEEERNETLAAFRQARKALTCAIRWIGDDGKMTPDTNAAIGRVRLKERTDASAAAIGANSYCQASDWFNICAEHAARLSERGMHIWEFQLYDGQGEAIVPADQSSPCMGDDCGHAAIAGEYQLCADCARKRDDAERLRRFIKVEAAPAFEHLRTLGSILGTAGREAFVSEFYKLHRSSQQDVINLFRALLEDMDAKSVADYTAWVDARNAYAFTFARKVSEI